MSTPSQASITAAENLYNEARHLMDVPNYPSRLAIIEIIAKGLKDYHQSQSPPISISDEEIIKNVFFHFFLNEMDVDPVECEEFTSKFIVLLRERLEKLSPPIANDKIVSEILYDAIQYTIESSQGYVEGNYEVTFLYPANNIAFQKLLKAAKIYKEQKGLSSPPESVSEK